MSERTLSFVKFRLLTEELRYAVHDASRTGGFPGGLGAQGDRYAMAGPGHEPGRFVKIAPGAESHCDLAMFTPVSWFTIYIDCLDKLSRGFGLPRHRRREPDAVVADEIVHLRAAREERVARGILYDSAVHPFRNEGRDLRPSVYDYVGGWNVGGVEFATRWLQPPRMRDIAATWRLTNLAWCLVAYMPMDTADNWVYAWNRLLNEDPGFAAQVFQPVLPVNTSFRLKDTLMYKRSPAFAICECPVRSQIFRRYGGVFTSDHEVAMIIGRYVDEAHDMDLPSHVLKLILGYYRAEECEPENGSKPRISGRDFNVENFIHNVSLYLTEDEKDQYKPHLKALKSRDESDRWLREYTTPHPPHRWDASTWSEQLTHIGGMALALGGNGAVYTCVD
jgi:hypothetical protein